MNTTCIERKLFKIPRNAGYEDVLDALVGRITKVEHFKHHAGCTFENEVFSIRPYYLGVCHCSRSEKLKLHLSSNPHMKTCFHSELLLLNEAFRSHAKYSESNRLKAERANEERRLWRAHGFKFTDGRNIDELCTCGTMDRFIASGGDNHDEVCPIVIPNFVFKPEDIRIYWYKIYFRESTCNVAFDLSKFKDIVGQCMKSVL